MPNYDNSLNFSIKKFKRHSEMHSQEYAPGDTYLNLRTYQELEYILQIYFQNEEYYL